MNGDKGGLGWKIVQAVNNGELYEPITREKISKLCEDRMWEYDKSTIDVVLSNSEISATHSPTYKKYFKKINRGEYILLEEYRAIDFEEQILKAKANTEEERRARLEKTKNNIPKQIIVTTSKFKRNPDVVVEVLSRANGICEECGKEAPFKRRSDNSPYLEVHHKKSLSDGGMDTVENCIAICPNCHRKIHFG